jgi:hypothetical protein
MKDALENKKILAIGKDDHITVRKLTERGVRTYFRDAKATAKRAAKKGSDYIIVLGFLEGKDIHPYYVAGKKSDIKDIMDGSEYMDYSITSDNVDTFLNGSADENAQGMYYELIDNGKAGTVPQINDEDHAIRSIGFFSVFRKTSGDDKYVKLIGGATGFAESFEEKFERVLGELVEDRDAYLPIPGLDKKDPQVSSIKNSKTDESEPRHFQGKFGDFRVRASYLEDVQALVKRVKNMPDANIGEELHNDYIARAERTLVEAEEYFGEDATAAREKAKAKKAAAKKKKTPRKGKGKGKGKRKRKTLINAKPPLSSRK